METGDVEEEVMERTGTLRYNSGESRLTYNSEESGLVNRLLARCDAQNQLSAATLFLKQRKLKNNQRITITYTDGSIGDNGAVAVFCITDARPADSNVP